MQQNELYGELLGFITIYLVELSSGDNANLCHSRVPFSANITGHSITYSGLSNWDWFSGLLEDLKIAEHDDSGRAVIILNGQDIITQFTSSPRHDILTLEYMLDVFIDLCGSYGTCLALGTRSYFQITDDYEHIFQVLFKHGYVTRHPQGYLWTDKMENALKRNFV